MRTTGSITQVIGAVVDCSFPEENAPPPIYTALTVNIGKEPLTLEVQQHLGNGLVRTVAMGSTDGLETPRSLVRLPRPADRRTPAGESQDLLSDPPCAAILRGAVRGNGNPGDGHQSHRPYLSDPERRKSWTLRRSRSRKDCGREGIDLLGRARARRILRFRWCW